MSDMKAAAPSAVNLASQIGEEDRFRDKLLRLAKENKVAVVSAAVILLFVLAAVFAPALTPYNPKQMDMMHRRK